MVVAYKAGSHKEVVHSANQTLDMASTSGYECNFVSEPDDALTCQICLEVARDPWQHGECGRLFCQNCLNEHGKKRPCPNCRTEQPKYLKDVKSKSKGKL